MCGMCKTAVDGGVEDDINAGAVFLGQLLEHGLEKHGLQRGDRISLVGQIGKTDVTLRKIVLNQLGHGLGETDACRGNGIEVIGNVFFKHFDLHFQCIVCVFLNVVKLIGQKQCCDKEQKQKTYQQHHVAEQSALQRPSAGCAASADRFIDKFGNVVHAQLFNRLEKFPCFLSECFCIIAGIGTVCKRTLHLTESVI